MSVYVDPITPCLPNPHWKWNESCHLFADAPDELHEFAVRLRLQRSYFQNDSRLLHYDLTASKLDQAVRLGAQEVSLEFVARRLETVTEAAP